MKLTSQMPSSTSFIPTRCPAITVDRFIFFMVAGTLAAPLDQDLSLVQTPDLEGRGPPDALVIHADGSITYRQEPTTPQEHVSLLPSGENERTVLRMVPDRALPATKLIEVTHALREAGADRIFVVTQRSLE